MMNEMERNGRSAITRTISSCLLVGIDTTVVDDVVHYPHASCVAVTQSGIGIWPWTTKFSGSKLANITCITASISNRAVQWRKYGESGGRAGRTCRRRNEDSIC